MGVTIECMLYWNSHITDIIDNVHDKLNCFGIFSFDDCANSNIFSSMHSTCLD